MTPPPPAPQPKPKPRPKPKPDPRELCFEIKLNVKALKADGKIHKLIVTLGRDRDRSLSASGQERKRFRVTITLPSGEKKSVTIGRLARAVFTFRAVRKGIITIDCPGACFPARIGVTPAKAPPLAG